MPKPKTVSIARKHIMAAIESCPCELDFPRYTIGASYFQPVADSVNRGVLIVWTIK